MENIKQYLNNNNTIKLMLLNQENAYWKNGGLKQISLDVGVSLEYLYSNYFEILAFCSLPFCANTRHECLNN